MPVLAQGAKKAARPLKNALYRAQAGGKDQ